MVDGCDVGGQRVRVLGGRRDSWRVRLQGESVTGRPRWEEKRHTHGVVSDNAGLSEGLPTAVERLTMEPAARVHRPARKGKWQQWFRALYCA